VPDYLEKLTSILEVADMQFDMLTDLVKGTGGPTSAPNGMTLILPSDIYEKLADLTREVSFSCS